MSEAGPGRDVKANDKPGTGRRGVAHIPPDEDPLVTTPVRVYQSAKSKVLRAESKVLSAEQPHATPTTQHALATRDSAPAFSPTVAEAFRRAADDVVEVGMMAVDLEGRQTYVNPAFSRMVGWSADELIGAEPPFVYWAPDEVEKIRGLFAEMVDAGGPVQAEMSFRRRGGERFAASVRAAPMTGEGGRLLGLVAT